MTRDKDTLRQDLRRYHRLLLQAWDERTRAALELMIEEAEHQRPARCRWWVDTHTPQ